MCHCAIPTMAWMSHCAITCLALDVPLCHCCPGRGLGPDLFSPAQSSEHLYGAVLIDSMAIERNLE